MKDHNVIKKIFILAWAYCVEIVAAAMVVVCLNVLVGTKAVYRCLVESSTEVTAILAGMLAIVVGTAAAAAGYLRSISNNDMPNGTTVHNVYRAAFTYAVIVEVVAMCAAFIARFDLRMIGTQAVAVLIVYALINVITSVRNVFDIARLSPAE